MSGLATCAAWGAALRNLFTFVTQPARGERTPSRARMPDELLAACAPRTSLSCTRASVGMMQAAPDPDALRSVLAASAIEDATNSLPRAEAAAQPSRSAASVATSKPIAHARNVGAVSRQKCVQSVTRTPCKLV